MRKINQALSVMAVSSGLWIASAWAFKDIPVDQLPKPVVEAIKAQFPMAELLSAEQDDAGNYEVEIRAEQDEKEVDITPEGSILEITHE